MLLKLLLILGFLTSSIQIAFADPCGNLLKKLTRLEQVHAKLSRVDEAALSLGLKRHEFLERLEAYGYTEAKFFDEVEAYKNKSNSPFWAKILNPKSIVNEIRGRQIANSTFLRDFAAFALPNLGAQALFHISNHGYQRFDLLSAQLFALILTDVALAASSAKHAAYLVAKPQLLKDAKKMVSNLDTKDQKAFNTFSSQLRMLLLAVKRVTKNTYISAAGMAKIAFFTSIVPFVALESSAGFSDTSLLNLVLNTGFHVSFVALWSNFRSQAFYGELMPAINNAKLSKFKNNLAVVSLVSVNVVLATFTYTYGSDYILELIKELIDTQDS